MDKLFHKKVLWSITSGEIASWFLFCACFAFLFYTTLIKTGFVFLYADNEPHTIPAIVVEMVAEYFAKALFTLPLWYLYFHALRSWKLGHTLLLHILTLPLFVFAWKTIYLLITDIFGLVKTENPSLWFHYFFPMVFYLIEFGAFHTYNFWLDTQKQNLRERELIKLAHQSEMKSLRAQIQPHFLFNTLNSISASVPAQQEHTRELIAQLAGTFRYALKASEKEWIPLHEEVEFVISLLQLEKARFGERLEYEVKGDYREHAAYIPPMLLQPIVENAIKHGIAPSIDGGKVIIDINHNDDKMNISVSNTGVKYDKDVSVLTRSGGVGLKNTIQRLDLLYGEKISIVKDADGYLSFSFNIPIGHRI